MLTILLFVAGFLLLMYGANWLVDGASSIAKKYRLSNVVIGMTIVALGTSAPELVVNVVASFKNTADVAIGNILGSNISNIFLIFGISAIIIPIKVSDNTYWREVPFAFLGALVVGVVANDHLLNGENISMIFRSDGIILLLFFLIFLIYAFDNSQVSKEEPYLDISTKEYSLWISVIMMVSGIAALILGGHWTVEGAVKIATRLGISEAVISLTLVALGTSLPELATCVAAALKKNTGIIIGNVLGSNIFNVFFVLGTSALIKPLPFNTHLNFDVVAGITAILLLWLILTVSGKKTFNRNGGIVFLVFYITYITFLYSSAKY